MRKQVTIWGAGFVGATAYQAFKTNTLFDVCVWDIDPENSRLFKEDPDANFADKEEALFSDLHMICVPTPMNKETGECDTSIVEKVVEEIVFNHEMFRVYREIVIKSTVPVGTCAKLTKKYAQPSTQNLRFMFNPEFLTEANAYLDFINLPYQIIGLDADSIMRAAIGNSSYLADLYDSSTAFGGKHTFHFLTTKEAEMVKLARNCYLATRLSFFNEMKQFADAEKIDFHTVVSKMGLDPRIGNHYNKVPGPDGKAGFSLSCLPKDINNVIFSMKEKSIKPTVLEAVWEKNLEVRPERDWEQMSKAVVSKKNNDD